MEWPFVSRREYQRALAERNDADRCFRLAQAKLSKMDKILMGLWDDSVDGGKAEAFDRLDQLCSIIRPNEPVIESDQEQDERA
jgi:hypothetical protein